MELKFKMNVGEEIALINHNNDCNNNCSMDELPILFITENEDRLFKKLETCERILREINSLLFEKPFINANGFYITKTRINENRIYYRFIFSETKKGLMNFINNEVDFYIN